jgi:VWFA-related protein
MILDNSGSTVNDFSDIRLAAQEFVGRLLRADRTSVSTLTWACQDFTDDSRALLTVLKMQLPTDWGSPIWAATDRAMSQLKDEAGRRIILLFSDGIDTQDPASTGPLAPIAPTSFMNPCTAAMPEAYRSLDNVIKRASAEGVMVYAVSVTNTTTLLSNMGGGALAKLSKETGTQYQRLGNYSEVKAVFRSIADELHLQYLLGFVPTATDGKPHAIDVKVKRSGVTVLARKSYIAEKK